jgi:hypothetical protein
MEEEGQGSAVAPKLPLTGMMLVRRRPVFLEADGATKTTTPS